MLLVKFQKTLRAGTAHGLMVWYDAEFLKGVIFHNKPGSKKHPKVYGSTFFPFPEPVKISNGDQ